AGTVQPPAVPVVGEHRDRPVMLGPGNPARALLAADQAALAVDRVAVGIAGWLAENAHRVGGLVPAEDPVVRDVAEDEIAPGGEVGGSLGPPAPRVQAFHPVIPATAPEPLVEHLELRLERFPHRILAAVVGWPLWLCLPAVGCACPLWLCLPAVAMPARDRCCATPGQANRSRTLPHGRRRPLISVSARTS